MSGRRRGSWRSSGTSRRCRDRARVRDQVPARRGLPAGGPKPGHGRLGHDRPGGDRSDEGAGRGAAEGDAAGESGRPSLLGARDSDDASSLEAWRARTRLQQEEFEMAAALTKRLLRAGHLRSAAAGPVPAVARDRAAVRSREGVGGVAREADRRVYLDRTSGYAIERLVEAIHPDALAGRGAGGAALRVSRARSGSTADVDFWTTKPVKDVEKSHLNYVVSDSKWENSAAYHLDKHPRVDGVREEPGPRVRDPVPPRRTASTSTSRTSSCGSTNGVTLILETKGGRDEKADVKAQAAAAVGGGGERRRAARGVAVRGVPGHEPHPTGRRKPGDVRGLGIPADVRRHAVGSGAKEAQTNDDTRCRSI